MARAKTAASQQQAKTRNRNGCKTCRARKIKCDGKKPACDQCHLRTQQCTWGITLKWETDFTARGLAFGRQGVWKKERHNETTPPSQSVLNGSLSKDPTSWYLLPILQSPHFVNIGVNDLSQTILPEDKVYAGSTAGNSTLLPNSESGDDAGEPGFKLSSIEEHQFEATHAIEGTPTLALTRSPSNFQSLGQCRDTFLVEYFIERFCPLTILSPLSGSPFASIILPHALTASPDAFRSILALSACHRGKTDFTWKKKAMMLKGQILQSLRNRMITEGPLKIAQDPQVLVIMMIMCQYEIIDKCDAQWVVHLRGARDILKIRQHSMLLSSDGPPLDPAVLFAERFFAHQDIMGRTACGVTSSFGSDYWDSSDVVDDTIGCSPHLIQILCAVTELSKIKQADPDISLEDSFIVKAASLENQLDDLVQEVLECCDQTLFTLAELKRLAGVIYLHSVLYDASPATPLIAEQVGKILFSVSKLMEKGTVAGLVWPVFVAAVELDPLEDMIQLPDGTENPVSGRRLVLDALDTMEMLTTANVSKTRAVVSRVWFERELHMSLDQTHLRARQCPNDWEQFIQPFSSHMSLV
jgi:Fungal specific transcription factor domain/Fungal Zn(2)-Cys(6) binuclear cluster domain